MNALIPHIYTFILPLFTGNILHMLVVKKNLFSNIAVPVSASLFGSGKTYRGFIVLPVTCGCCSLLVSFFRDDPHHLAAFSTGYLLGFFYLLGELPNSYIKRKMGISSGETHPAYRWVQLAADKLDSLLLLALAYYFLVEISPGLLAVLILLSFLLHIAFSWILFRLRLKKSI
jgi:CDP-diacylglycerol--serine O-phosphatidyltransferase